MEASEPVSSKVMVCCCLADTQREQDTESGLAAPSIRPGLEAPTTEKGRGLAGSQRGASLGLAGSQRGAPAYWRCQAATLSTTGTGAGAKEWSKETAMAALGARSRDWGLLLSRPDIDRD